MTFLALVLNGLDLKKVDFKDWRRKFKDWTLKTRGTNNWARPNRGFHGWIKLVFKDWIWLVRFSMDRNGLVFNGLDQVGFQRIGSGWFQWIGSSWFSSDRIGMFFMDDRIVVKVFQDRSAFSRFFKDLLLYLVRPGFRFVT